jgi:DNA-binding transcriptional ArsR family regulator
MQSVLARDLALEKELALAKRPVRAAAWNPRPPGVMRDGAATKVVLAYLQARPRQWFSRTQIVEATGKTQPAVQWALHYLRAEGLVECTPEVERNPRYLRYRCVGA